MTVFQAGIVDRSVQVETYPWLVTTGRYPRNTIIGMARSCDSIWLQSFRVGLLKLSWIPMEGAEKFVRKNTTISQIGLGIRPNQG